MAGSPDTRAASGSGSLGTVGVQAAAHVVGASPSAIRLWERQGLVAPARTSGGTRRYSADDVARLQQVRRLRAVEGLNAPAIRRLIDHDGPEPGPSTHRQVGSATSPPASPEASVAPRLREMRLARGLTLREAALRSGLSISFVSALERGLSGASIAALRRLLGAYDATLADLLGSPSSVASALVTRSGRRVLDTGDRGRIENLAEVHGMLESQLFILAPGASSHGTYSHPGEEFMFVLDGALAVWVGETEAYRLEAGDALTFRSSLAYRFEALGSTETRLLWINTPPTF